MKHTIDTKVIQELAAMSPEVKVYLEREFPDVFDTTLKYFMLGYKDELTLAVIATWKYEAFRGRFYELLDHFKIYGQCTVGCGGAIGYRPATTEEIQKFIPDYKPE